MRGEIIFGSPCKFEYNKSDITMYGRVIGIAREYIDTYIIATPQGSVLYIGRDNMEINMSDQDISIIKELESTDIENDQWYHKSCESLISKSDYIISHSDISKL